MKEVKINKQAFSFEDFEEGLMLAGLITPSSILDLQKREALEEYEAKLNTENSSIFFKRVTLAAEIAAQLHAEPTLGRIKFQKLMYLCEHAADLDLNDRYAKQAAGPFDSKFMHSIEAQFKKHKWFLVEKLSDGKYSRTVYKPLDKTDGHKKYYDSYFKDSKENIKYIIELFRTKKTDPTEIAATLYACIIELQQEGSTIEETHLLTKFYKWSEQKSRFTESQVLEVFKWMKEKGVIPKSLASED